MIKFLIMDVDGTLTDGKIYMSESGELFKAFDIKDGYGINNILPELGIIPIIITGRKSDIVKRRCEELSIKYIFQGITNKLSKLDQILKEFSDADGIQYNYGDCAYIGDDIYDLQCMHTIKKAGGWTAAPADAISKVKDSVDYISELDAGRGAVRDCICKLSDMIQDSMTRERVKKAIKYILEIDKSNLKNGKYKVDDYFYFSVQEYETKEENECRMESHKKYIDIQYIVEGIERIDNAYTKNLKIDVPYNWEDDIIFWKNTQNVMSNILTKGSMAVFYPNNAHRPCMNAFEKSKVKKIVGKVRIS